MSSQPGRRPNAKRRPQARKGRTAAAARGATKRSNRTSWLITAAVIAVGVGLVIAFAGGHKNSGSGFFKGDESASASLVAKVTGVPQSVINQVGAGSVTGPISKLPGPPLLTKDGKPRIIYLGAEFCPYCATERWAMVNALSRFGTFKNLKITYSAEITTQGSPEVYPGTPTFSFHGATYSSPYIQFEPVEQEDNSYKPLETATKEQADIAAKYDQGGGIPFITFANEYMISGATYDPQVLQNKTRDQIAAALSDPSSDVAKGAIGAANALTSAICKVDGNKPANVCTTSTITSIQGTLPTK